MIGIIIVTHGKLGDGLLQSVQSIVGPQDNVGVLTITPHDSLAGMRTRCAQIYAQIERGDGVLIMTDILGGTSCNASLPLAKKNVAILTGVNLPMLLSAVVHRKHLKLPELSAKVLEEGQKSLIDAKAMFLKKLK